MTSSFFGGLICFDDRQVPVEVRHLSEQHHVVPFHRYQAILRVLSHHIIHLYTESRNVALVRTSVNSGYVRMSVNKEVFHLTVYYYSLLLLLLLLV